MYNRFLYFKKLYLINWIMLIFGIKKFFSNSLGIRFWKFCSYFEIAWVVTVCVGVLFLKSILRWSFSYMKEGILIWFHANPRNINPRFFNFWSVFHSKPFSLYRPLRQNWYQKTRNFLAYFLVCMKSLSGDVQLPKRLRKC